MSATKIIKEFEQRDIRALSKILTCVENEDSKTLSILEALFEKTGKAKVVGITGPPGAGKSTLIGELIRLLRDKQMTVAVIAVDPVSPLSGGAVLGDRVRLNRHFIDNGVFIRSLSSRGKLGGLSASTRQMVHVADAFGFDYIIIETVGVGQSEVDVRKIADLTAVVLVPEWGDAIQTMKAGLLEIGDIFIIHKADREGAATLACDLREALQLGGRGASPVIESSVKYPESLEAIPNAFDRFFEENKDRIRKRRAQASKNTVTELLERLAWNEIRRKLSKKTETGKNPYQWMGQYLKKHPPGRWFK
ncbi:MAG: methylmalonyl Co-A mutase-associated GTPase MeaB [Deltaproteobacteria bacterium]|nr:methylmalonyl Co-A mutase-associated GTPase MeaB [Deltaproteobacteria bacterium]